MIWSNTGKWYQAQKNFDSQMKFELLSASLSEKHRKNCECCHHHSLFKGHNVIVHIVVLNCQKCNQCLKCHVSGHKKFQKLWKLPKNPEWINFCETFMFLRWAEMSKLNIYSSQVGKWSNIRGALQEISQNIYLCD